jgi:raw score 8.59
MIAFLIIVVLSAILTFISFPFLMSFACMDAGMGPGSLGCIGAGMVYTAVAFIVFIILGITLNCYLKKKNK